MTIPAPLPPYPPTNDLVAVAWLRERVPGLEAGQVATTLPAHPEPRAAAGAPPAQALPAGGPDIDLPRRLPVVQIDAWATASTDSSTASKKPPWNLANRLVELVRLATENQVYGRAVTLPGSYGGARVQAVYLVSEPSRVLDDPSGYARYTADLAIDWVPA